MRNGNGDIPGQFWETNLSLQDSSTPWSVVFVFLETVFLRWRFEALTPPSLSTPHNLFLPSATHRKVDSTLDTNPQTLKYTHSCQIQPHTAATTKTWRERAFLSWITKRNRRATLCDASTTPNASQHLNAPQPIDTLQPLSALQPSYNTTSNHGRAHFNTAQYGSMQRSKVLLHRLAPIISVQQVRVRQEGQEIAIAARGMMVGRHFSQL